MAAAPGLEPEELVRADNQREAQRLFAAARRHIGAADLGAILAVVAAAHLLDDPMALPPLGDGEGEDLSDLPAVLRATLDRLLAAVPQWRSYLAVPSLLARGHAARELDEALRVLT